MPTTYPAPVAPTQPRGVTAPGSPFVLDATISGASGGSAAYSLAEYTKNVSAGRHVLLTGLGLQGATFKTFQNDGFDQASVTTGDAEKAAIRFPVGKAWDYTLLWIMGADGISSAVPVNNTTVIWVQPKSANGQVVSIYGRNLAHGNAPGSTVTVVLEPVGPGACYTFDAVAVNPYLIEFTPVGVPIADYNLYAHNRHGQNFGWSKSKLFKIVAPSLDDPRYSDVRTHDYGPPVLLELSETDGVANSRALYASFRQNRNTAIRPDVDWPVAWCELNPNRPEGAEPDYGCVIPQDNTQLCCSDPNKTARLKLVGPGWDGDNRGMYGSHYVNNHTLKNVELYNLDNIQMGGSEALLVFDNTNGLRFINVKARWNRPYETIEGTNPPLPKSTQTFRTTSSQNLFFDRFYTIGSGIYCGNSTDILFTDYTGKGTHNADNLIYFGHCKRFAIKGADLADLDATSADGVNRCSGRGPKMGGQDGSNECWHFQGVTGTLMGPLFTGPNPYFDRNQGEFFLQEGNRTVWQSKTVLQDGTVTENNPIATATATTITFTNDLPTGNNPQIHIVPGFQLIRIARGRGLWQIRGIVSAVGKTVTLDEPLNVLPDAGSLVQVGLYNRFGTIVGAQYSGKRIIVDEDYFGIQNLCNVYGGCHDIILDDCHAVDARNGLIITNTTHGDGFMDGNFFIEFRRCTINGTRWAFRNESAGHPEHPDWNYNTTANGAILVSECGFSNFLEAGLRFKTDRAAETIATKWTAGSPPSDLFITEEMPVFAPILNDNQTTQNAITYPPIPLAAGTVANFVQAGFSEVEPPEGVKLTITAKFTPFFYVGAGVALTLDASPWLAHVLAVVAYTEPDGNGLNEQVATTGTFGGGDAGGTLDELKPNGLYLLISGEVGWDLPDAQAATITI